MSDPPDGDGEAPSPDASAPESAGPRRLDPHRAVAAGPGPRPTAASVISTRRYQWMVGVFGMLVILTFSVYLAAHHGGRSPGIPAGGRLHDFVAPLATGRIDLPANANPRCDPARRNPAAINVCSRTGLVLDFFVTGSDDCVRAVDALQRVAGEFPGIRFAAVSVRGSLHDTAALVRSHHWTIPVGIDTDGRVGDIYGVELCPMIELARPGGLVAARLIGARWQDPARLAAAIRRHLGGGAGADATGGFARTSITGAG